MATELTQKVTNEWRDFFSSREGQIGLAWLKEQKPKVFGDTLEAAALSGKTTQGYDEALHQLEQLLETGAAPRRTSDEERGLR